jgi:hypothetical protein
MPTPMQTLPMETASPAPEPTQSPLTTTTPLSSLLDLPPVTTTLVIGNEPYTVAVDGDGPYLIFGVDGTSTNEGDLIINNLIIQNGGGDFGAAIMNSSGVFTLKNSVVQNIGNPNGGAPIVNLSGEMQISGSMFQFNNSEIAGAILNDGYLAISTSTFKNNVGDVSGVIFNGRDLTVSNSTFFNNTGDAAAIRKLRWERDCQQYNL